MHLWGTGCFVVPAALQSPGLQPTHGTRAPCLHLQHLVKETKAVQSRVAHPESPSLTEAVPGACLLRAGPPGLPQQQTAGPTPLICQAL